ncbi:MAG: four helix bundle protein [Saprospiraceae bacterium]|jgi:four helix bundle protein|nr:four helix bundle protein [Saprospiraceae bacterium]MBP6398577.1 four helix bundle protein [Saprospiraceae bacterium]MBP9194609.1 four helix bundle protein [Saprospiraceae bacterium]
MKNETNHRNLEVWKLAMLLVKKTYHYTSQFPINEMYGLTTQLRRASVSICANIAEGKGRLGRNEFKHFLNIARGSTIETMSHLEIALMLGFINSVEYKVLQELADRISAMLYKLINNLQ